MIAIIDTGIANLASVRAAFTRLDRETKLASAPADLNDVERVVLPGVGAFGPGMARLQEQALAQTLTSWIADGRPLLAVCLGLQLLCRESEESPGIGGLGIIDAAVERFTGAVLVPQLGWNQVSGDWLEPGYAYFANSYRLRREPAGWRAAYSDHGGRYVAALSRDRQLACQFHPELSGDWGAALIARWLSC